VYQLPFLRLIRHLEAYAKPGIALNDRTSPEIAGNLTTRRIR
jgi:hypothetical protein